MDHSAAACGEGEDGFSTSARLSRGSRGTRWPGQRLVDQLLGACACALSGTSGSLARRLDSSLVTTCQTLGCPSKAASGTRLASLDDSDESRFRFDVPQSTSGGNGRAAPPVLYKGAKRAREGEAQLRRRRRKTGSLDKPERTSDRRLKAMSFGGGRARSVGGGEAAARRRTGARLHSPAVAARLLLLLSAAAVAHPADAASAASRSRFTAAELAGSYCASRTGVRCCRGREDECTAPIRGNHLCYCDYWCDEHHHNDCCPDFERTCRNVTEATCVHEGIVHTAGATIKKNCNYCRCTQSGHWDCDRNACVVEQWLVDRINSDSNGLGWQAASYSSMRGLTLSEGVRLLLGTRKPAQRVVDMLPISLSDESLPAAYDARTSSNLVQVRPPPDQGLCGSDWVVAVADVVADRLSRDTNGSRSVALSVQDVLDCGAPRYGEVDGCRGGRVEQAFWILKEAGAVPERCYPYTSGDLSRAGSCGLRTEPEGDCQRILATPAYRISAQEQEIRKEIFKYGPVLAVMTVRPDFFLYRSGIYSHSGIAETESVHDHTETGMHAVRIIGWGSESGRDYWLVVNSWGRYWGENGLFRITRGVNESGIESFVIGTWSSARVRDSRSRRRRLRQK